MEGDRKYVPGVVRAPGIFEDDLHGATMNGAAEIKTVIAVVGPGGNYLPVPFSYFSYSVFTLLIIKKCYCHLDNFQIIVYYYREELKNINVEKW
jgi:hypothetical protein